MKKSLKNVGLFFVIIMNDEINEIFDKSKKISYKNFGRNISFYHPGMFRYNGSWGKYPAISITGSNCDLQCDHCKGKILETMIPAKNSDDLYQICLDLEKKGNHGCLISGGSFKDGSLPWDDYISGIKKIKEDTNLFVSVHCGILDKGTAKKLKDANIDQALIDVIGDDETLKKVYHCDFGIEKIKQTIDSLDREGIPFVPHIVVGLNYGNVIGEYKAIDIIKNYSPLLVTIVSLMSLKGTPMEDIVSPDPLDIAKIIAKVKITMPDVPVSLGCARDRSNIDIELYALDAGVNRLALPSDEAIKKAKDLKLNISWQKSCCSIDIK